MKLWILLLACATNAFAADGWRLTKVDTTIVIDPTTASLRGHGIAMAVRSGDGGPLTLRLNDTGQSMEFVSVDVPGAAVRINEPESGSRAMLAIATFRDTPPQEVTIRFETRFVKPSFPMTVRANVATALAGALWYPVISAESIDAPPGRTTFDLPADWRSAATGRQLRSDVRNGRRIETWETPAGMRRAFIAAPYRVSRVRGRGNAIYLLSSQLDGDGVIAKVASLQAKMEQAFGPLPYPDYLIAEVPNDAVAWYGASEPGLIISRTFMLSTEEAALSNAAHEVAHGWWGNLVDTTGPGAYLLREGLASFTELDATCACKESLEHGTTHSSPDATTYGYFELLRAKKDVPLAQLVGTRGNDYNTAQSKGVWFLLMLRDHLGKPAFDKALRAFITRYAGKPVTLPDFRNVMLDASTDRDETSKFLAQWLDRTGAPLVDMTWRPAGTKEQPTVEVTITQRQTGEPYTLPLELEIASRRGRSRETVRLTSSEQTFTLPANGTPIGVALDPDHKLLLWRESYGPRPE